MALILNGILGNVTGKVGGVVGSNWKGRNTLRAYSKPANPRTEKQLAQRAKMTANNEFSRPLVGPVFNTYWDPFLKTLSAFNMFCSQNIAKFTPVVDYSTIQILQGKLTPIPAMTLISSSGSQDVTITFDKDLIPAENQGDTVFLAAYNVTKDIWAFNPTSGLVSAGSIDMTFEGRDVTDDVAYYAFYSHDVDAVLRNVSTSTALLDFPS